MTDLRSGDETAAWLAGFVRDIPDFPQPGVGFKDITPLLADARAFATAVEALAAPFQDRSVEVVVGIEARGLMLAAPVAHALGAGFVPMRKVEAGGAADGRHGRAWSS